MAAPAGLLGPGHDWQSSHCNSLSAHCFVLTDKVMPASSCFCLRNGMNYFPAQCPERNAESLQLMRTICGCVLQRANKIGAGSQKWQKRRFCLGDYQIVEIFDFVSHMPGVVFAWSMEFRSWRVKTLFAQWKPMTAYLLLQQFSERLGLGNMKNLMLKVLIPTTS